MTAHHQLCNESNCPDDGLMAQQASVPPLLGISSNNTTTTTAAAAEYEETIFPLIVADLQNGGEERPNSPRVQALLADHLSTPPITPPYFGYQRDYVYVPSCHTDGVLSVPSPIRPADHPGNKEDPEKSRMVASGIAGAIVGSLLFGPFLGAIAGFGSAYATQKPGATGDIARALGEVAITTQEKALDLDQKHQLVDKGKISIVHAWEHAKELDRQYRILDRVKDFVLFSWRETVDLTRRHRLLERGVEGIGRGFELIFRKICDNAIENEDGAISLTTTPARTY